MTSPATVAKVTSVMPGPAESLRVTGISSRDPSQAAIRSAVGFPASAATSAPEMAGTCWSSVAAITDRHGVARVQPKSVSPGA
jgi:hypothetical protein